MSQCAGNTTRERRHQRGAAVIAHGVVVYPPQRVLPSRSRASGGGRGASAPLVHHRASTALVRCWALGAAYRGQCRYTCMVVSGMPAHAAQCPRPSSPTLPYALARPPFVRACACQRAIAGGVASSPCRYHAPVPLVVHRRYWRRMSRCTSSPLSSCPYRAGCRGGAWSPAAACALRWAAVRAPWSHCTAHFRASGYAVSSSTPSSSAALCTNFPTYSAGVKEAPADAGFARFSRVLRPLPRPGGPPTLCFLT
jgi:hypothetical protein